MTSGVRSTTWILLALVALFAGVGLWIPSRVERAQVDADATEESVAAASEAAPVLNEQPDQIERALLAARAPNEASAKPDATPALLDEGHVGPRGHVLDLAGQPVAD